MAKRIVSYLKQNKEPVNYEPYSARLPEFLQEFGPKQGYRVEVDITDLLSLQRGRLALLREAVIAGKKPADVGLPSIEGDVNILVFTAKLLDAQDRVVRVAHASMKIEVHKDFERLETAANQRLIASCGYGSDVFDADENDDLVSQGFQPLPAGSEPFPTQRPPDGTPPSTFEEPTADAAAAASAGQGQVTVSKAERRQLENLAERLGQPVPVLKTAEDVRKARRELGALDARSRSGNGRAGQSDQVL